MIWEFISFVFPGARLLKLIKTGINITNSTTPLEVTANITLTVLDCCAPPPVRLVGHCIAVGALIGVSITAPNPLTIGSAVHIINEIYEKC